MDSYHTKIELYKQRQFGDKLNATFNFLRQEARPYFKAQMLISGPVAILCSILYGFFFVGWLAEINNAGQPGFMFSLSYFLNMLGTLIFSYILIIVVALVNYIYMRLYHEKGNESPTVSEVFEMVKQKLPGAIGLMIVMGFLIMIGFIALVIPGIYFMVVGTLTIPILVNDDTSVFDTISRAFKLINDKWWSTFGLLIITGIIASLISMVISLPASVLFGAEAILSIQSGNLNSSTMFSPWVMAISSLLSYVGSIVGNTITQSAVGFQYYNLVEMKESRGLMEKIDGVGRSTEDDANEGIY